MSDFRKLLYLLRKELAYQEKLLSILVKERVAITTLKREDVEKIRLEKEKVIEAARSVEEERSSLMHALSKKEEDEGKKAITLGELLVSCAEPEMRKDLVLVREELRDTVQAVINMNDHNKNLLKQSLGIIASTLAIIRSAPGTDLPTYSPSGSLKSDNDDPAFARRSQFFAREA